MTICNRHRPDRRRAYRALIWVGLIGVVAGCATEKEVLQNHRDITKKEWPASLVIDRRLSCRSRKRFN